MTEDDMWDGNASGPFINDIDWHPYLHVPLVCPTCQRCQAYGHGVKKKWS